MIGLGFFAAGLLWLAMSWYLASRLPKWFRIAKPLWRWVMGAMVLVVLLVGPFVDHIVGMRQFERLCAEETNVRIGMSAANVKRTKHVMGIGVDLEGYAIPIRRYEVRYLDRDTEEVVGQYNYFSTAGGRIGGFIRLGSRYSCSSIFHHPDLDVLTPLRQKLNTK